MYKASSMIANSTLEFTLSGKPNKIGTPVLNTGTTQNLSIGLGAFGIVLIAVGVWLYRKNRLKVALQQSGLEMGGMAPEFQLNALPEDEETLMDAIITLDDQYHEGNLPEDAYLERRAVLKEKLKQLDDR
jgi:LPXTG-motif cell wall-anchored protein